MEQGVGKNVQIGLSGVPRGIYEGAATNVLIGQLDLGIASRFKYGI